HAPHHPGSPESKVPEQHDAIDPTKPLEDQKHPSDHAKAQEKLRSEHSNGHEKFGSQHTIDQENHGSEQEVSISGVWTSCLLYTSPSPRDMVEDRVGRL
ncbi:hypothetical protein AAH985_13575, partial [Enterococcus faecium]